MTESVESSLTLSGSTHMHARTHARTHAARTHARTHARAHARTHTHTHTLVCAWLIVLLITVCVLLITVCMCEICTHLCMGCKHDYSCLEVFIVIINYHSFIQSVMMLPNKNRGHYFAETKLHDFILCCFPCFNCSLQWPRSPANNQ